MAERLTEAEQKDRDALWRALQEEGYVVARAAEALGIHETTLSRRIRRYGLDAAVEARNPRLAALRQNRELPPAPHEVSRQALEQKRNREHGLCGCGRPPVPLDSGAMGRSCARCRERDRRRKGRPQHTGRTIRTSAATEIAEMKVRLGR